MNVRMVELCNLTYRVTPPHLIWFNEIWIHIPEFVRQNL